MQSDDVVQMKKMQEKTELYSILMLGLVVTLLCDLAITCSAVCNIKKISTSGLRLGLELLTGQELVHYVTYLLTCAKISVIVLRRSLRVAPSVDAWPPNVAERLGRGESSEARPLVVLDRSASGLATVSLGLGPSLEESVEEVRVKYP